MGDRTKVSDFCKQFKFDPAWFGQFLATNGVDVDRAGTVSADDFCALMELLTEVPAKANAKTQAKPTVKPKPKSKTKKSPVKLHALAPSLSSKEVAEAREQLSLPLGKPKKSGLRYDRAQVHRERLRVPGLFARYGLTAIRPDGDPSPSRFLVTGNQVYVMVKTRGKGRPTLPFYLNPDDFHWLLYMHMGTEYLFSAEEIAAWKGHCFPVESKYEIAKRAHLLRNPPLRELTTDPAKETDETACVAQMLTP